MQEDRRQQQDYPEERSNGPQDSLGIEPKFEVQSESSFTSLSTRTSYGRVRKEALPEGLTEEQCSTKKSPILSEVKSKHDNAFPDVLPSFEMFQNLHSSIPLSDFDDYLPENPPYYEAVSSNSTLDVTREPNVEIIRGDSLNSDDFGINRDSVSSRSATSISYPAFTPNSNSDGTKSIPVEKLYSLPRADAPIAIDIFLTKNTPNFGQKPEFEGVLREYTSGDTIQGYCTVENVSSKPVKFDMFYLTLEGSMATLQKSFGRTTKTTKRFLRMVDLAASWSYNEEDETTGEALCNTIDPTDKTRFGLHNDRTLYPGDKRKKFFNFKVPNQLLDVTCTHSHFPHSLLPPSLGYDMYSGPGSKYMSISEDLGYGRLSGRGAAIATIDNSGDSLINYSIDARLVGRDAKGDEMCILSESKFNLRIIPFGFDLKPISMRSSIRQLNDFDRDVSRKLEKLEKLFFKVNEELPIFSEDVEEEGAQKPLSHKVKYTWEHPTVSNSKAKETKYTEEEDQVEAEMSYSIKSIFDIGLTKGLFKGMYQAQPTQSENSAIAMTSEKNGLILVKSEILNGSFPYWSPYLMRKQNGFSSKNKHNQKNWFRLKELLTTEELEKLEIIKLELSCMQASNSTPHDPPEVSSISTELICLTENSRNCRPVLINPVTLLNPSKYEDIKKRFQDISNTIESCRQKFMRHHAKINKLYVRAAGENNREELAFRDFMPARVMSDVTALATMNLDIAVLRNAVKVKIIPEEKSRSQSSSLIPKLSLNTTKTSSSLFDNSENACSRSSKWKRTSTREYSKTLYLEMSFVDDLKETLVPSFQSCLCSRSYVLRVKIIFEKGAGGTQIDIPIQIKNINTL